MHSTRFSLFMFAFVLFPEEYMLFHPHYVYHTSVQSQMNKNMSEIFAKKTS